MIEPRWDPPRRVELHVQADEGELYEMEAMLLGDASSPSEVVRIMREKADEMEAAIREALA